MQTFIDSDYHYSSQARYVGGQWRAVSSEI